MTLKGKEKNKKKLLGLAVFICVAAAFAAASWSVSTVTNDETDSVMYDQKLLSFNNNWDVSIDGKQVKQQVILPDYVNADKNSDVAVTAKLPGALTDGTYIAFKSTYAFVEVYADGKLLYRNQNVVENRPLSSWHFILLDKAPAGALITLKFKSPYPFFSGILPEVIMGTHAEALLYASSSSSFAQQLSLSVVILGFLIFVFSFISGGNEGTSEGFIFLGMSIAVLGIMLFFGTCSPRTNLQSYYVDHLTSHVCLRTVPVLYAMYLYSNAKPEYKKTYLRFVIFCLINFVLCNLLNFLSDVDFVATMGFSYALASSVFALALFGEFKSRSDRSFRYKALIVVSAASFAVCAALEVFTHIAYIYRFRFGLIVLGALIFSVLQTAASLISAYERMSSQLITQKEYNQSKIKLMISQIQPHFIYNSLTTIRIMIKHDPDKAYKMIYDFSNYLSYNFNSIEDVPLVPFSEELKHIKTYTDIELERFFDRLKIVYDIQSDKFALPPLSVQPYVENAIKHGVCKKVGGGTVTIKSFDTDEFYVVQISDDGIGFDVGAVKGKRGIGIKNAGYRLESLTGAKIEINSVPMAGTDVNILIPKKRRSAEDENDIG